MTSLCLILKVMLLGMTQLKRDCDFRKCTMYDDDDDDVVIMCNYMIAEILPVCLCHIASIFVLSFFSRVDTLIKW